MKLNNFINMDILKIVLPATITVLLFVMTIFWIILPAFEEYLVHQKKMMISAETKNAYSILYYNDQLAASGLMTLENAKQDALEKIEKLRYGHEGKDYFWVNDLHAKLLAHPYRKDLVGQDLSEYTDPNGKFVFDDFVKLVNSHKEGYQEYLWQWKDDSERVVPKISFVKLYEPWGWVVGTGVYLEDIRAEISRITEKLIVIIAGILTIIFVLAVFMVRNGVKERNKRKLAERELFQYQESLESIISHRTQELKTAMEEVKILSGFLPICSSCKKIRDDQGNWNQLESYIDKHSEAKFSHGICPDCTERLYPEFM